MVDALSYRMASFQLSTALKALIRVARPQFRRRQDRVAYAVHTYFLCQGYTLVGVGPACEETLTTENPPEVPLEGWNDHGELYIFAYAGANNMEPVIVKCLAMGNVMVICASSFRAGAQVTPRTMNIDVKAVTTDAEDVLQGYVSLDALVEQFVASLGEFKVKEDEEERRPPSPVVTPPPRPSPLMEPMPRGILGERPDRIPLAGGMGGSRVGLNDPRFAPHLRHPELMPSGRNDGVRYDPIGPPGMPGYFPEDFQPPQRRYHPDLAPPGPRTDFDPDNMFG